MNRSLIQCSCVLLFAAMLTAYLVNANREAERQAARAAAVKAEASRLQHAEFQRQNDAILSGYEATKKRLRIEHRQRLLDIYRRAGLSDAQAMQRIRAAEEAAEFFAGEK